jgi:hypothetical protein
MSIIHKLTAVASFSLALVLLFHVARSLPVVWQTLRQLGREPTTYFVLRIGTFSFSGWQLLAIEGIVLLTSIACIWLSLYAFTSVKPTA